MTRAADITVMSGGGNVHGPNRQQGSALIMVLMMVVMVGVLTLTLATLSVSNLGGARRAQQAGMALNAADAGLAQAVEYVRTEGVRALTCSPTCTGNPWGNSTTPTTVKATLDGTITTPLVARDEDVAYEVWIEKLAAWSATGPGLYRVHSVGKAGSSARREVVQDVMVAPHKFPLGIFGKSISGGGNIGVHNQSIFSTGCVSQRKLITFSGITDILNEIPPSVHSSHVITEANDKGLYCADTNKPIHSGTAAGNCNPAYPYDQDSRGGPLTDPLTSTACLGAGVGGYPQTSKIVSDADLFTMYNLTSPPLTPAQLDQLKTVAISQGNYWTSSSVWTRRPNGVNAVMYFDLLTTNPGGEVNLNDIVGFARPSGLSVDPAVCASKSLVIIVDGGNVRMNSDANLAASLFVLGDPYGNVNKINGGAKFIGTLYANTIDLKGGADLQMDECFRSNLSPALFDVETSNYRELDR